MGGDVAEWGEGEAQPLVGHCAKFFYKKIVDKVRPRVKLGLAQFGFQLFTNSKNNPKFVLITL